MAERRRPRKDFLEDKIVQNLVPDPGRPPPDSVVLYGYMGKSDRDGHRRLYLDDSLSSWVEIPEEEILHVETTPEDESGTAIWVTRSAQLETRQVRSATAPAEFLSGDIARGLSGDIARGYLAQPAEGQVGLVRSLDFMCKHSVGFGCDPPTSFPKCHRLVQTPDLSCNRPTFDFLCPPPPETWAFPCAVVTPDQRCPPAMTPDLRCPPAMTPDLRCPPARTAEGVCPVTMDPPCFEPPPPTHEPRCFRATPNPNLCKIPPR